MGTIEYLDGFDEYSTALDSYVFGWNQTFSSIVPGRFGGQAAGISSLCTRPVTPDAEYTVGVAWKPYSLGNQFIIFLTDSGSYQGSVLFNSDGTFSVRRSNNVTLGTSSAMSITGVWYYLELYYKVDNTAGAYELRLNGNTIVSGSGVDTQATGNAIANAVGFGASGLAYYDDVVMVRGSGFLGDVRVKTLMPDSNGTHTDWATTSMPAYQAAGTAVYGTSSAPFSVTWPTHTAGDVALLFVESTGGQAITLSDPQGFVEVTNSPQSAGTGTSATRLTAFWCRATSDAMPAVGVYAGADHAWAYIVTFRGCIDSGDPWDTTAGDTKASASTSFTAPSVTTSIDRSLVVLAVSNDYDGSNPSSGWTNANLANLTERYDAGTSAGNGGNLAVATGEWESSGACGTTSGTVVTSTTNAMMAIALRGPSAAWDAVNDISAIGDDAYIYASSAGDRASFDFPAVGISGDVKAVAVAAVTRKDDAGTRAIATMIRSGGTDYDGTAVDVQSGYTGLAQVYETDPDTGSAWTVSGVDAAEFGIKLDT